MISRIKEMAVDLEQLEALCGSMIRLTQSEREALVGQDLESMNRIAGSKNDLTQKIVVLRDDLRRLTRELAPDGATVERLSQLLPLLPETGRALLLGPYEAYKTRAGEVEFHNAHNMLLAKQGLKAIESRVGELVTAVQGLNATYRPPGQALEQASARVGRVHREA